MIAEYLHTCFRKNTSFTFLLLFPPAHQLVFFHSKSVPEGQKLKFFQYLLTVMFQTHLTSFLLINTKKRSSDTLCFLAPQRKVSHKGLEQHEEYMTHTKLEIECRENIWPLMYLLINYNCAFRKFKLFGLEKTSSK